MQAKTRVPLPRGPGRKHAVQADISKALYDAVKKEADKEQVTITEVVAWGFAEFLQAKNPAAAAALER